MILRISIVFGSRGGAAEINFIFHNFDQQQGIFAIRGASSFKLNSLFQILKFVIMIFSNLLLRILKFIIRYNGFLNSI